MPRDRRSASVPLIVLAVLGSTVVLVVAGLVIVALGVVIGVFLVVTVEGR